MAAIAGTQQDPRHPGDVDLRSAQIASAVFLFYIFFAYDNLGLPKTHTEIALAVLAAVGIGGYYLAVLVQRRRGVDITLNYAEIPPE